MKMTLECDKCGWINTETDQSCSNCGIELELSEGSYSTDFIVNKTFDVQGLRIERKRGFIVRKEFISIFDHQNNISYPSELKNPFRTEFRIILVIISLLTLITIVLAPLSVLLFFLSIKEDIFIFIRKNSKNKDLSAFIGESSFILTYNFRKTKFNLRKIYFTSTLIKKYREDKDSVISIKIGKKNGFITTNDSVFNYKQITNSRSNFLSFVTYPMRLFFRKRLKDREFLIENDKSEIVFKFEKTNPSDDPSNYYEFTRFSLKVIKELDPLIMFTFACSLIKKYFIRSSGIGSGGG